MKKKVDRPSSIYWDFKRYFPVFSFVIEFLIVLFLAALFCLALEVML